MRRMMAAALVVGLLVAVAAASGAEGFEFKDTEGKCLDLLRDGKVVTRYMYEVDTSSKARTFDTSKVFTHVFNAEGTEPITKGSGGLYPHHRGVFLGFSRLQYDGTKRNDWWHARNVTQRHQKFIALKATPEMATSTILIHWNDGKDQCVVAEERTQVVCRQEAPGMLLLDFISKLTAARSDIELNGDPEHAGMQFRPSQKVAQNKSAKYFFHKDGIKTGGQKLNENVDLPWAAVSFEIDGKKYTVQHMNHPGNPTGTRYSAYRNYGRFGAFPTAKVKKGESVTLRYRIWVGSGEQFDRPAMQKRYEEFAKNVK